MAPPNQSASQSGTSRAPMFASPASSSAGLTYIVELKLLPRPPKEIPPPPKSSLLLPLEEEERVAEAVLERVSPVDSAWFFTALKFAPERSAHSSLALIISPKAFRDTSARSEERRVGKECRSGWSR